MIVEFRLTDQQVERIRTKTKKWLHQLEIEREQCDRNVEDFVMRCRSHDQYLKNAPDFGLPPLEVVTNQCNYLLAGISTLIRRRLPKNLRRGSSSLLVDWSHPEGWAYWAGHPTEQGISIKSAVRFASIHEAGFEEATGERLADCIAEELANDSLSLPRLTQISRNNMIVEYRWESAKTQPAKEGKEDSEDKSFAIIEDELVLHQRSPVLAALRSVAEDNMVIVQQKAMEEPHVKDYTYLANRVLHNIAYEEVRLNIRQNIEELVCMAESQEVSREQILDQMGHTAFSQLSLSIAYSETQEIVVHNARVVHAINSMLPALNLSFL
jgi:hypothetical protein